MRGGRQRQGARGQEILGGWVAVVILAITEVYLLFKLSTYYVPGTE